MIPAKPYSIFVELFTSLQTRGVSHFGLAICIKKYLKVEEELWKFKYFTMQKYNFKKSFLKKPKSFKRKTMKIKEPSVLGI
jgi:hypothetical protein